MRKKYHFSYEEKAKCLKYIDPIKNIVKYERKMEFESEILLKYTLCKFVFKAKKNIIKIKGSTYSWYSNCGKPKIISIGNKITALFLISSVINLIRMLKPIELKTKSKKKLFFCIK